MGNTIAETYTDELYLSKNELKTALHTSLIEGPWNEIAGYRKRFSVRLEMQTIKGHPMGAILTQAIRAKLNLVEVDFRRLINKMRTIAGDELTDERGVVIASSQMIIDNPKIAIDPASESDREVFEQHGYNAISLSEFTINMIVKNK